MLAGETGAPGGLDIKVRAVAEGWVGVAPDAVPAPDSARTRGPALPREEASDPCSICPSRGCGCRCDEVARHAPVPHTADSLGLCDDPYSETETWGLVAVQMVWH